MNLFFQNITLRPFQESDAPAMAEMANNPGIASNLTDKFPHPYSVQNASDFIAMATSHPSVKIFCIEYTGKFAGGIGLHPESDVYRTNAELGYWIGEPYWGKGIVTTAISLITDYGFTHLPEIQRIYARPFTRNAASMRVLEKTGFTKEAVLKNCAIKNGRLEDQAIYSIWRS